MQLKQAIKQYETELDEALKKDLGKSSFEAYTSEIGFIYSSIDNTIKHLKKWARPRRVKSDIAQLIGTSSVYPSAYGVVLIIGPFNYPVQLLLEPLVGFDGPLIATNSNDSAISGNYVVMDGHVYFRHAD